MAQVGKRLDETRPSPPSYWIVSLRATAIVGGVFGFSCLGVLVVVTAIEQKSALATVALALAILAFTVQLIVFVAQQSFASEQGRRNEELYGSMQGVLAEIREKASGIQEAVHTINEKMLEALLLKTAADPTGGQVDLSSLLSRIMPAQGQAGGVVIGGAGQPWPERRPDPNDALLVQKLRTYPREDEVGDAMTVLEGLSQTERENLKAFGEDEIISRRPGSMVDPSLSQLAAGGLEEKGLVEPYPADRQSAQGIKIMHLTDRGRGVARLLSASGDPPGYLAGLKEIRDGTGDRLPGYQILARQ